MLRAGYGIGGTQKQLASVFSNLFAKRFLAYRNRTLGVKSPYWKHCLGGMEMDMRIVFVLAVGLAGCASRLPGETVFLENASGERVQCGPYTRADVSSLLAVQAEQVAVIKLRDCIEDFQRSGYERVQGPE
jgi:hypothetical protein